jgi:thiol:disulfide interchange protein DsbD
MASLLLGQAGLSGVNSWIEQRLSGGQGLMSSLPLLFLGGLIASLLPCVYPLYPITASIIRSRAGGSRSWVHPLTYYAGTCLVYGAFGALAVVSGGAFNMVMQYAATNLAIAALLLVLGLSTMGLLHLPLFHGRDIAAGEGIGGTLMLGAAAGLLSSACVGPVVVSVLVTVAAAHATAFSWINLGTGVVQMLAFGAGVGVPFLLIGLFGVKLPSSGQWMLYVQYLLGALICYFAYVYLEKGLSILELTPNAIYSIAGAAAGIILFAYLLQSGEISPHARTVRSLYCLGAIVSASMMFHNLPSNSRASSGPEITTAVAPRPAEQVEKDGNLTWHLDEETAFRLAHEQGRNVFIDFYGSWCTNCKTFAAMTRTDSKLQESLAQAILLKVYDRTATFKKYAADSRFPELKVGLPFFVITDPDGNLLYKTSDYLKTDEMALFVAEGP